MILLIDNYDSFSYNLVQLAGTLNPDIRVIRNDAATAAEIAAMGPSHIILSPGPGRPADAGVCEEVVRDLSGRVPILGVCLGHQAICEAFGGTIVHAPQLMHGKASTVTFTAASPLFAGLPSAIRAARYHSLAADPATLPNCLTVTATAADGTIMAVQHRGAPTYGLQFHPESILTPDGRGILERFFAITK